MAVAATAGYVLGRNGSTSSDRPADRLRRVWVRRATLGPPPPSPPPPQWSTPPGESTEFDLAREREASERHRAAEGLKEHPLQKDEPPPPKEKRKRVSKKIKDPHEDVLVPPHLT